MGILLSRAALSQTGTPQPGPMQQMPSKDDCVQPAPLFSAEDYDGPLNKFVAYFSRKLEIKTVHGHDHSGKLKFCALRPSEKLRLFVDNNAEPVTFIVAGYNAGLDQASDNDHAFGQGAAGYGKRYGAALADQTAGDFFHTFLFPVVFRQDPRYYRRYEGTFQQRLGHALTHTFVASRDSGGKMFNFSQWLGTACSTVLSNAYHPGNERGVRPVVARMSVGIASDAGFDVLREFWPEIVHKLKLPFRERNYPVASARRSQ